MSERTWRPIADDELTMPWSGRRVRAIEATCAACDKPFLTPLSAPRKYCGTACFHSRPSTARQAVCEICGTQFRQLSKSAKYCSHPCYAKASRGPRVERAKDQHVVNAKGHPIAPPSGTVAVARLALYEKIGPGEHPCNWCGETVAWKLGLVPGALIADHLNFDRNDDSPENLVASCNSCNGHRTRQGNRGLIEPGEPTVIRGGRPTRAVERFCNTCGTAFLTTPAEVDKGKGRYCSRACMYARNRSGGDR